MFIESLTISGFTGFDDRSFRFEPAINYFPAGHLPACALLDWFLNERHSSTMLDDYSAAAYLEIRLRSANGGNDVDRFAELRGVRLRDGEDRTRVSLRRDMALPDKVVVDGKGSLGFETFRFEMEQLGLVVKSEGPVPLNVVGPQEMAERVLAGERLLGVVRECFRVDLLRMQAGREQGFKMELREKWNKAMREDVAGKAAEFKDRIESTQVFRKLQKTLDAMSRGVVERELATFGEVSQRYATELRALVEQRELLAEKEEVLRKHIDREDSVTNSALQVLAEDIRLGIGEADCSLAMMTVQEKSLVFNSTLQKKVETMLETLQDSIGSILEWNVERFRSYEELVQKECEIELAENCLHLRNVSGGDLKEVADKLNQQLEVAKDRLEQLKISNDQLEKSLQEGRHTLVVKTQPNPTREGQYLIEKLAETALEDLQSKLAAIGLSKQLDENQTIITDSVKLSECLSLESIRTLAQLRHVIDNTRDDLLKSDFVGFAYEHLKFIDSTVTKQVLPRLEHIYTLAIFKSTESIQKLLELLPPNLPYNLLALDTFNPDEIPTPTAPNLHPLAVYLHDSSLKPILCQLLNSYYCTTSPYDQVDCSELPDTITVIYLADDITTGADGLLSYGHPPSVEFLADTIVNCVVLGVDALNIQRQLAVHRDTSAGCQRVMEQIMAELIAAGEDTFER